MRVELGDERAYEIVVGAGLYANVHAGEPLDKDIVSLAGHKRVAIITDTNVAPFYLGKVEQSLAAAAAQITSIVVDAGEGSKRIELATELWSKLARAGIGRDGLIVALGGGVVGDLSGFVASTYLRGVAYLQMPTTLLAMVDSSIGGKTAINLPEGKNLVGTFTQPAAVVCDLDTLTTLPEREWLCGMAEVAKSALLNGGDFLLELERDAQAFAQRASSVIEQQILRSLEFKAHIVEQDEHEHGVRECLNYGHTLAHALETIAGYGALSHGQAVAEGMRFAADLGREVVGVSDDFIAQQASLLDALGLAKLELDLDPHKLLEIMLTDKKVRLGAIRFIFVTAPGVWQSAAVSNELIERHLQKWLQLQGGQTIKGSCK